MGNVKSNCCAQVPLPVPDNPKKAVEIIADAPILFKEIELERELMPKREVSLFNETYSRQNDTEDHFLGARKLPKLEERIFTEESGSMGPLTPTPKPGRRNTPEYMIFLDSIMTEDTKEWLVQCLSGFHIFESLQRNELYWLSLNIPHFQLFPFKQRKSHWKNGTGHE